MSRLQITFVNCSNWIAVSFLSFLVIGCGHYKKGDNTPPAVPYKVAGASDPHRLMMKKRLENQGVKVITIGQNYLISIPAAAVFANNSPRVHWESYGLLNDVACYLKQFRKVAVNVNAFTGKCVSPQRDLALTTARSHAIADYLWSQNIDSRFIFTHGLGSDKPILALAMKGDQSINSRIEITFRDEVA
ncbi:type IVB secretion system protein IcmN/DotK [Legionella yabuuchiae]|uniref:type IVB secretion system protein IcmN/DotK n=1 Tax=Legionella yabuuchiae TaxID=376727 RepID=UPI001F5F4903|nr:type IVB secretion system protein IcmN/DotK [Legionella yabuuchiae]